MADTIPLHYTTQFSTNWIHRLGQMKPRLDAWVVSEDFDGERKRYDRMGRMTAQLRTERKGPTRITDASTDSRWAVRANYDIANLLDKDDEKNLGQLVLPTSDYIAEHATAYNKACDDVAWTTALGPVLTGEQGTTQTPFPTSTNFIGKDGTVGSDTGTAAGLTIDKLIKAKEILDSADADEEAPRVLVCTPRQISDLLGDTKVASADYNTVRALVAGQVDTFMGFTFKRCMRLPLASSLRTCVAWVRGSIKVIKGSKKTMIDRRADLSQAIQIYSDWYLGGTRVHDEAVLKINCKEA